MKNILFCLSFLILGFSCQDNNVDQNVVPEKQIASPTEANPSQEKEIKADTALASKIPPIFRLDTLIDFDSIVSIQIRNDKGLNELSPEKWNEIEFTLQQSIYIYGLLCERQKNALIFTFKNGKEMEGYFCSGHINFANSRIHGSFRLGRVIDLQSL